MRQIKFRAWDKLQSKFVEPIFNEFVDVNDQFEDEDFIFLQFTGLLDKNGVEIYEGDILATNNGEQYSVKWSDEFFKFKISCRPKGFSHVQSMSMASQVSRLAEVIGNIHENPELINSEVMKGVSDMNNLLALAKELISEL